MAIDASPPERHFMYCLFYHIYLVLEVVQLEEAIDFAD